MVLRKPAGLHSSLRDNYRQNNGISKTLENPIFSRVLFVSVFSGIVVKSVGF